MAPLQCVSRLYLEYEDESLSISNTLGEFVEIADRKDQMGGPYYVPGQPRSLGPRGRSGTTDGPMQSRNHST